VPEGRRGAHAAPRQGARQGVLRLRQLPELRLRRLGPVAETCPECGYLGAEAKRSKTRGDYRKCLKCGNEWDVAPKEEEAIAV
jgi:hypothetical protein